MRRRLTRLRLCIFALLPYLVGAQDGSGRAEEPNTLTRIRVRHSRQAETSGPTDKARHESKTVQAAKRSGYDHLHMRIRTTRGGDTAQRNASIPFADAALPHPFAPSGSETVQVLIEATQKEQNEQSDIAAVPSHSDDVEALAEASPELDIELVIARLDESMDWLNEIPEYYKVIVYSKGGRKHPPPSRPKTWGRDRVYKVVVLPNQGGEANSFAEHLVRNYDTLAQYTIFSHGNPFLHNKHFLQLLEDPTEMLAVQTMSAVYSYDVEDKYHTPSEAVEAMQKNPLYRSERTVTRTLNSAWYHDEGAITIQKAYRSTHQLPQGANLIRHHLGLLGLPEWMPEKQEICSFAFGGMIGFERSMAQQHPKRVYELLLETTKGNAINAFVIERVWLVLLGGPNIED